MADEYSKSHQANRTGTVYRITCLNTGRSYVGGTTRYRERRHNHLWRLRNGTHRSALLQKDYDQYGEGSIEFVALSTCHADELAGEEQKHLDELNPEYNTMRYAFSGLGYRHTEEAKEAIRSSRIGRAVSEEVREKISRRLCGRSIPEDVVMRRSAKLKGRKRPRHVAEQISKSLAGKPKSESHRERLRAAGETLTESQVRDIRLMRETGSSYKEIGEKHGISITSVGRIVHRQRYSWVT